MVLDVFGKSLVLDLMCYDVDKKIFSIIPSLRRFYRLKKNNLFLCCVFYWLYRLAHLALSDFVGYEWVFKVSSKFYFLRISANFNIASRICGSISFESNFKNADSWLVFQSLKISLSSSCFISELNTCK